MNENVLRKNFSPIKIIVLFLPIILMLVVSNAFYKDILILVMLWSAAASAWNLLGGYTGQLSIAHASFFGIGAYTSTLLFMNFSISPWLGMIVGGFISAAIGIFIGSLTFPLKGPFFSLATLAFLEVTRIIAINWTGVTEGSKGIVIPYKPGLSNFIFESPLMYGFIAWLIMILTYLVSVYFGNSRLGYYLMAYRENEDASRALGINTVVVRLKAIAISSFLTALIGSFYAQYILFIDPESLFLVDNSLQMVLISLVGGVGTAIGPIIGGYLMVPLGQFLRAAFGGSLPGLHLILYGICMVLILFYLPKGIISIFVKLNHLKLLKLFKREVKQPVQKIK
jgi:branched-chain amino acid transport system permease protein